MGGWPEELWYSAYQVARLQHRLGINWTLVLGRYLEAYQLRPSRAEPLLQVARHYRENAQYRLGCLFAREVLETPSPDDLLCIEESVYDYELPLEYAVCCFHLAMKDQAARIARKILAKPAVTEEARQLAKDCAG